MTPSVHIATSDYMSEAHKIRVLGLSAASGYFRVPKAHKLREGTDLVHGVHRADSIYINNIQIFHAPIR